MKNLSCSSPRSCEVEVINVECDQEGSSPGFHNALVPDPHIIARNIISGIIHFFAWKAALAVDKARINPGLGLKSTYHKENHRG